MAGRGAAPAEDGGAASASTLRPSFQQEVRLGRRRETAAIVNDVFGSVDRPALRRALDHMWARHDVLRSRFVREAEGWRVELDDPARGWPLREHDVPHDSADAEGRARRVVADAAAGLDQDPDRLVDALLVGLGSGRSILALLADHVLVDGVSARVLVDELGRAYAALATGEAPRLDPLGVRYYDYAVEERRRWESPAGRALVDYWEARFREWGPYPPRVPLPRREAPTTIAETGRKTLERALPSALAEGLVRRARLERASPFMTTLGAFLVVLRRVVGSDRLGVAFDDAGRHLAGTERTVGQFAYSLPLWIEVASDAELADVLPAVRQATLEALAHSIPPRYVLARRPAAAAPGADGTTIYFTSDLEPLPPLRLPGTVTRPFRLPRERGASTTDVDVAIRRGDDGAVLLRAGFDEGVYDPGPMAALLDGLAATLDAAASAA